MTRSTPIGARSPGLERDRSKSRNPVADPLEVVAGFHPDDEEAQVTGDGQQVVVLMVGPGEFFGLAAAAPWSFDSVASDGVGAEPPPGGVRVLAGVWGPGGAPGRSGEPAPPEAELSTTLYFPATAPLPGALPTPAELVRVNCPEDESTVPEAIGPLPPTG